MTESAPTVVNIPGPRMRLEESTGMRTELLRHLETGNTRLVLDFTQVDFVDSSFLGLLIIVLKRANADGGDVRICCLRPQLVSIFTLMRLDKLFRVFETRAEAIESFQ
jgi:anti-sigma B factor antagonist